MTVKKSKKAVLEYDPLSWLKEDANETSDNGIEAADGNKAKTAKSTAKNPSVKKVATKKAAGKKQTAKKATVNKVNAKKTVDEKLKLQGESSEDTNLVEGANFGFFEADEPVQSKTESTSDDSIAIGSELTIKNVASFKQCIDENLAKDAEIRLDSNDLQKIDTAGLQLLYCLQKNLQKSGRQIEWVGRSDVVESASKIIGMELLFDKGSTNIEQDQGFGFF